MFCLQFDHSDQFERTFLFLALRGGDLEGGRIRCGFWGATRVAHDRLKLAQQGLEAEQKTVLFVTHDIDEAIFMANRVAVFSARPGRIKTEVQVDFSHPRHYTLKTTPEFMAIKAQLTEEIRAESMAAHS